MITFGFNVFFAPFNVNKLRERRAENGASFSVCVRLIMQFELEKVLQQARKIEEHRTTESEKAIRQTYKQVLNSLREFIGVEYAQLAENDELTYEILQRNGEYARFLQEIDERIDGITPEVSAEIKSLSEDMYKLSYEGMVNAVEKTKGGAKLSEELQGLQAVSPEVIKKAVENPVSGLTLSDTLEKHRKEIIYDIKRNIGVGLANGDRMSTMAKRIKESIDKDYRKAITIARTEAHRVREAGHGEAARDVNEALKDGISGMVMMKTWRTMKDSRVRKTSKANHKNMDGVQIPVDEEFDLGHGVKAKEPGNSGNAANDIHCRCYLSYDLVEVVTEKDLTAEDFKGKLMKNWNEKFVTQSISQMDKQIAKYKNDNFTKTNKAGKAYDDVVKTFGGEKEFIKKFEQYKKDGSLSTAGEEALNLANEIQSLEKMKEKYSDTLEKIKVYEQKKTFNSKKKDLEKKLKKHKIKTYSGIWKFDVTTEDYKMKSSAIQMKKEYFSKKYNETGDDEFLDLYSQVELFEQDGKDYYKIKDEIDDLTDKINALSKKKGTTTGLLPDAAYTQERKDAALWSGNKNDVDEALRPKTSKVWRDATKKQKEGAWQYTAGSGGFNRPLRGYDGSWDNFKGVGKVDLDNEGYKHHIEALTEMINASTLEQDMWLQRGIESSSGTAGFLGISEEMLSASEEELKKLLLNKVVKDEAFMSCGSARGTGFNGTMVYVYAPKGTKALYAEPFSNYGNGDGLSWNGVSGQNSFGGEFETIIQRGTSYRITKVVKDRWGDLSIDVEIVEQI